MRLLFPSILLALYVFEGKNEMGLLSRIGDRLDLMSKMSAATCVSRGCESTYAFESGLHNAMWRCVGCRNVDLCKQWLSDHEENAAAPDFCANSTMFNMARERS